MVVECYVRPDGTIPVHEYLDGLDKKLRSKTLRSVLLLKEFGSELGYPDSRYLEDGIFELRTAFGGNIGRVCFFFCAGDKAILTHGFVKKSMKTPRREIDRAKRYREDYLRRVGVE